MLMIFPPQSYLQPLLSLPPPCTPTHTQSAKLFLGMVADNLQLSGAAEIDALVDVSTGEIIVTGVDPLPDLSPASLLFKQVGGGGGGW
jgi:hypothetical protein